ncbi:hypothetical protein [Pseudoteredinibacter isoporae]|uniref:Uncharacterized protein n=1 Tax=Pseudoteredinibacter isoporae TaxID=570281 RepID=A0A7X0JXJ8_9GAMM|nr:hypothetical protein [Pseudoteredinibacter isoporae]MBB6523523.1 hypothetical protein [Pseudoteredinibacter isoporae]NHO89032.1 hypothetical protein [Pseudoteredinibacter isoporae]NIB22357.1 hypothetical protein [Pseudoteredinibacter isoporae]
MSNDKNSQREATLMALDQLAQTLEVMNGLVRRLKLSLDQNQHLAQSSAKPAVPPKAEAVNQAQHKGSTSDQKRTLH